MSISALKFQLTPAAAASEGFDPVGPIIIIASVVLAALLMTWIFRRRSKASLNAATGDGSDALAFVIAPAPPWPDSVAVLRELVGETSPEPRITRYSRPVVAVDGRGLTISEKKIGRIVSVSSADVVSVEARAASIRPKGTLVESAYPSVWIRVRRGEAEGFFALTPIIGAYTKISDVEAESIAVEVASRLGVARG